MRSDAGAGDDRFPRDLLDVVRRLHDTPHRFIYTFAGVGSWTLALLHAVGGSSRSVLEATDAYHPSALRSALTGSGLDDPDRAVSPEVAHALATRSRERAHHLVRSDAPPGPTFGVGLTGTIASDRTKRGSHRFELAVHDGLGTERISVTLEKGARDRMGEEEHVARWVLHAMGRASGILGEPAPSQRESERLHHAFDPGDAFTTFLEGRRDVLYLDRDGEIVTHPPPVRAIVSGSFHPMHHGHLDLAQSAEQHLGEPVAFEMAPTNAEKEPTSPLGIRVRAAQAYGVRPLVLTRAPLFTDKVQHLPGTVFVVGVDTARRVLEPRFYGSEQERDEALERIRRHGGRFLVAGRAGEGAFRTLLDLDLPAAAHDLFEELPGFRVDVSSTELRTSWH